MACLALAGCVGIPTSGPIQSGGDIVVDEPGVAIPLPSDPVLDADPAQIVNGFLNAGAAGLADDFEVARKFLTIRASDEWNPRARVLLYPQQSTGPVVAEPEADGVVRVTVPVEATVDGDGRYTEAVPGSRPEEMVFELQRDSGDQWRISSPVDGVVMNASSFESLYRSVPLYFVSRDGSQLVPDNRWFATVNTPTLAVSALLAGPSPWLRDAVVTGAPDGARLSTEAVTVSAQGIARVDLAQNPSLPGQTSRNLLQAQLTATLGWVPVTGVEVTVAQLPWDESSVPVLDRDEAPRNGPYVLQDGRLAVVREGAVEPVEDAAALTGLAAHSPAVSFPDESIRVVLDGPGRLMLLPLGAQAPVEIFAGGQLVAPSIDRFGWIWTGEAASDGTLRAVAASGEVLTVDAAWLEGRTVRSLRVARDGSRVAIVSAGAAPGDVVVNVAAVVRDDDGQPRLLSAEPLPVGGAMTDATEVAWLDEVDLAVLGTSRDATVASVHVVRVGGPTRSLTSPEDATGIAVGRGERSLYQVDAVGDLLVWQTNSWMLVASGVSDPVFPG